MKLDLITPEKVVLSEEIDELSLETSLGQITILPHHENLITKIEPGEMIVKKKGKTQYLAVTGGFLQVSDSTISIISDYAIRSDEIEVKKAMQAQQKAEEIIKNKKEKVSEKDFAIAQAEMLKSITQLNVAKKRRSSKI